MRQIDRKQCRRSAHQIHHVDRLFDRCWTGSDLVDLPAVSFDLISNLMRLTFVRAKTDSSFELVFVKQRCVCVRCPASNESCEGEIVFNPTFSGFQSAVTPSLELIRDLATHQRRVSNAGMLDGLVKPAARRSRLYADPLPSVR